MTLDDGYTFEVVKIDKNKWHGLMTNFEDYSFYQTCSYGTIKFGEKNINHLILKKNDKPVSIVQVIIRKVKVFKLEIAYINWGPLWKHIDEDEESRLINLRNMIKALKIEYAIKRKSLLRIMPKIIDCHKNSMIKTFFDKERFIKSNDPLITAIVDLTNPLEKIRSNLSKSWKESLRSSEKNEFEFIEDFNQSNSDKLLGIEEEMKVRKDFYGSDRKMLVDVSLDLPDYLKPKLIICNYESENIAAIGGTISGKTGYILFAATGDKALKVKASFLLWWKMICFYKEKGYTFCDLAGINKSRNPGGYFFKKGLSGKNFEEIRYIGIFDYSSNFIFVTMLRIISSLKEFKIYFFSYLYKFKKILSGLLIKK